MSPLHLVALLAAISLVLPQAGPTRHVRGRVVLARDKAELPQSGRWVILHRVGRDSASPLDSVRSDAAGRFAFRYAPFGDSAAVYFVSSLFGGIAYFSAPLGSSPSADGGADITLFDTSSAAPPPSIASRHVIVGAPEDGDRRTVIELFVVANSGDRTLVSGRGGRPTFEATLPRGASDPEVAEGDVAAGAITFGGGVVRVTAPLAPGTKRISYSYRMRAGEPLTITPTATVGLLELLVEDSTAAVTGAALHEDPPTVVAGRTFRRFTAQELPTGTTLELTAHGGGSGPATVTIIGIGVTILMAGTLIRALRRRHTLGQASAPTSSAA